jgi:hypothetical protein
LTILIAGQGRKAGKTTAVCGIIAATSQACWTAVKLTSHGHGADLTDPVIFEEHDAGGRADTGRYLAAGAIRALWVRCSATDIVHAMAPIVTGNVIIESNTAVGIIPADLVVFVSAPDQTERKPSASRAAALADIAVDSNISAEVLDRIRSMLSAHQP